MGNIEIKNHFINQMFDILNLVKEHKLSPEAAQNKILSLLGDTENEKLFIVSYMETFNNGKYHKEKIFTIKTKNQVECIDIFWKTHAVDICVLNGITEIDLKN